MATWNDIHGFPEAKSDLRERVARIIRQAADDCADKMPGAEHYATDAILALVRADEAAIRRAALEEAAAVAFSFGSVEMLAVHKPYSIAAAIRALAEKEPGETYSTPVGAYSKLGTPYSTPDPAAVRRAALEEAADVLDADGYEYSMKSRPDLARLMHQNAAAIRALAEKEPTDER